MKRINRHLFLLLFLSATAVQSVNAGPWGDWFKEKAFTVCYAPFTLMGFTARFVQHHVWENIRPVTQAELQASEGRQKEEITKQADEAIKHANSNHKAANKKYAVLRAQQNQLQDKAGILNEKAQQIQGDVSGLGKKLEHINTTCDANMLQIQEKIDQVKKQKTLIEQIMKSVEAQCKKRAEQAKGFEQKVISLKENAFVVSRLISQCSKEVKQQPKRAEIKKNIKKIALITNNWQIDWSRENLDNNSRCGSRNNAIGERY